MSDCAILHREHENTRTSSS